MSNYEARIIQVKGWRIPTPIFLTLYPQDVYLLVGANGSGKTAVFDALRFLKRRMTGHPTIDEVLIQQHYIKHVSEGALSDEVTFEVSVGEEFVRFVYQDLKTDEPKATFLAGFDEPFVATFDEVRRTTPGGWLSSVYVSSANPDPSPSTTLGLIQALEARATEPSDAKDTLTWMLNTLTRAFPSIKDFESAANGSSGQLKALYLILTVGLASPGSLVALDAFGNSLHPHVVRTLIRAFQDRAEAKNLSILLSTFNHTALDCFGQNPENVLVMQPNPKDESPSVPTALTDLFNQDWLLHFHLGDLFDRLQFGAPDYKGS